MKRSRFTMGRVGHAAPGHISSRHVRAGRSWASLFEALLLVCLAAKAKPVWPGIRKLALRARSSWPVREGKLGEPDQNVGHEVDDVAEFQLLWVLMGCHLHRQSVVKFTASREAVNQEQRPKSGNQCSYCQ